MNKYLAYFCFIALSLPLLAAQTALETKLSSTEAKEIEARLNNFYSENTRGNAMSENVPKMSVKKMQWADPNPRLKWELQLSNPLLQSAGKKSLPEFHKARCEHLFKGKFPYLECKEAAFLDEREQGDPFVALVRTWITSENIARDLNSIPVKGAVDVPVWSGDYWRMQWGLTSYRYAEGKYYKNYKEAVDAYHQPGEWLTAASTLIPDELSMKVFKWSPAEKYDLLTGDESMTLTLEQKNEGYYNTNSEGDVESWFGICHGWAPASFMVPSPNRPVTAVSSRGTKVTWYPDDVKAIATLAWANGGFRTNFIGGRCEQKNPETYENGRLTQANCFDNNPYTFHLSLGNMIGNLKKPVIMDAAFDYQVWNQPILSYEFTYFNPLDRTKKGQKWEEFVVPYDNKFKSQDRFQKPLTRGEKLGSKYDDSKVSHVVGVMATIVYLAETTAIHEATPVSNSTIRVTYTYDLEFETNSGKLVPTGGEWHENRHPDFLWVPEKESFAQAAYDSEPVKVDLAKLPERLTTVTAVTASQTGYPLCKVLSPLVEAANGHQKYPCLH